MQSPVSSFGAATSTSSAKTARNALASTSSRSWPQAQPTQRSMSSAATSAATRTSARSRPYASGARSGSDCCSPALDCTVAAMRQYPPPSRDATRAPDSRTKATAAEPSTRPARSGTYAVTTPSPARGSDSPVPFSQSGNSSSVATTTAMSVRPSAIDSAPTASAWTPDTAPLVIVDVGPRSPRTWHSVPAAALNGAWAKLNGLAAVGG